VPKRLKIKVGARVNSSVVNIEESNGEKNLDRLVLGWVIANSKNELFDSEDVEADIFSDIRAQEVFKTVLDLESTRDVIDKITVENKSTVSKDWIDSLFNEPTISNEQYLSYVKILRSRFVERAAMSLSNELREMAKTEGVSAESMTAWIAEEGLRFSRKHSEKSENDTYSSMLKGYLTKLKERSEEEGSLSGVSSGFKDLDTLTSGFQPGDLILVAGRPSMGKTAFSMNVAESVMKNGGRSMIFSMEMPSESLLQRTISSTGKISQTSLRSGTLSEFELSILDKAVQQVNEMDVIIDDEGSLTMNQVSVRARAEHAKEKLDLIAIDYVQLMSGPESAKESNRTNEIGEISRGIKKLAKELNVPILLLSQLNRSLESRPNKRPLPSDLRESGGLEQDADLILFVYRDEVYDEETDAKGLAEIIIGKQRNGPLGTAILKFTGQYCLFEDASQEEKQRAML